MHSLNLKKNSPALIIVFIERAPAHKGFDINILKTLH